MSDNLDDGENSGETGRGDGLINDVNVLSFGQYAVIAPGVQIILDGRTISSFIGG